MSGKPEQQHGVLVVDKPSGPTSTDCLNQIKRRCGQKKIGHAGTLDPLASGVLVVLLGRATKLAPYLTGASKTYLGELRLGLTTDTYDIQGVVLDERPCAATEDDVRREIAAWAELTEQEVPAYSAAKHQGKPLYELARKGEEVPRKVKEITIFRADAVEVDPPGARFRVTCSAGTYIRSLVHSLGTRLGCGAAMTALRREESRPFDLERSHPLDEVLEDPSALPSRVVSMADALPDWPRAVLGEDEAKQVKNGVRLSTRGQAGAGARALFLGPDETPLALAEARAEGDDVRWHIERGLW